jgi:predicted permease
MQTLLQDLRFGRRMLARNPGFALLVAGLLALGIGANTVIFSLFDAVFLRPLPVRRPAELVRMVEHDPKIRTYSNFPYAYYEALHDHATNLAATFGETGKDFHFTMSDPEPAEEITVHGVTRDFFNVLGVRAQYGRVILPDDANETPGMPPAVLSYGFWRRRFGGDARVVNGRTILVNGHRFVIVGVMPRDFNGLTVDTAPDVRIPLRAYSLLVNFTRERMWFELAGRLKPEVARSQAEAECRVLWRSTMENYLRNVFKMRPEAVSRQLAQGMELEPVARGVSLLRDRYGDVLKLLMASVALLLLIVCTNVAGLLLERAAARQQEITVRLAVGATRSRLVRQVLAENLPLAGLGAAAGLVVAVAGMPLVIRALPPMRNYPSPSLVPLSIDLGINWRVFLFLVVLSLVTTLLFSVSPALAVSRSNLDSLLRSARSSVGVRGRQALIALQIAFCTFLLAIASLFVRTFQQLQRVDPGFDRDHIATFTLNLNNYTGKTAVFLKTFTERVRAIPAVVSVGISSIGVMRGTGLAMTVAPAGQRITPADFLNTSLNSVSPGYFDTMGMHILVGRALIASGASEPKHVGPVMVVVNQAFLQRFFPNTQPVGVLFGQGVAGEVASGKYEIVGVVSDTKYRSLRAPVVPTFYTCGTDFDEFVLNVRTRTRPEAIIEPVRKTLASLDPGLPFLEVHTMAEEVDNSMAGERIAAALASLFGGIAALLVGVGIYGLLAYLVMQRRREIGIRIALGAQSVDVLELIARQTLAMTAVGIMLGVGAALVAGPGIRSLLYGVSPQDPKSLVAAGMFVVLVAALATVFPAIRATRVDPMAALRYE